MDILRDDELLDIYLKAESKDDDWAGIRAVAKTQEEQTKKARDRELLRWIDHDFLEILMDTVNPPLHEKQSNSSIRLVKMQMLIAKIMTALNESKESGGE